MTLINRKIDKIRQKVFIADSSGGASAGEGQLPSKTPSSSAQRVSKVQLSAKDSDLLKQLINVRSALLREKAVSEELCDNIETTEREIKEMHF